MYIRWSLKTLKFSILFLWLLKWYTYRVPHFDDRFRIKSYGSLFFIDDRFRHSGFLVEKFDVEKFFVNISDQSGSRTKITQLWILSFENRYQMALLYEFPAIFVICATSKIKVSKFGLILRCTSKLETILAWFLFALAQLNHCNRGIPCILRIHLT